MGKIAELHDQMMKAHPMNDDATMLRMSFHKWFMTLTPQTIDSPYNLKQAKERVTAFRTVNGSSPFGAEPARATLRPGMTHPDVNVWQAIIKVPLTGKMDTKTIDETKAYQKVHGLKADSIVGPATWATAPASGVTGKAGAALDKGKTAIAIVVGTTVGVVLASAAIGIGLAFLL